jgi:hypothetical protein
MYLYADRFGTPTNAKKYTLATWFRIAKTTSNHILSYNYGNGNRGITIQVRTDQTLRVNDYTAGSTDHYDVRTNRAFRDFSAWYHLVVAYDSTQGTAADRVKIYINGVQETSFAVSSYPSQDLDSFISATPNNNKGFIVGAFYNSSGNIDSGNYFTGNLAQYIFSDGYAYAASTFGSTNANGIWIPNTSPSVTYGTNGFKLDFADTGSSAAASNFGSDSSGNNNHFAVNNISTGAKQTDTPHNSFAKLQEQNAYASPVIGKNGLEFDSNSSSASALPSTMAVSAGKWYAEFKVTAGGTMAVGVSDIGEESFRTGSTNNNSVVYGYGGQIIRNGSNVQTSLASFTTNDIIGISLNMDTTSGNVAFTKNGSAVGSAQDFANKPNFAGFFVQTHTSSGNQKGEYNFGQPVFTIASGNADANGHGNFEYAVPSGYYALCSKNLGLYGG